MPLLVLSVGSASVQYELLAQLCIWTPVASVRVPVVAASLTSMHSLMFYKHIPFSHAYWPYTRCPSYRPWPSPVLVPRYVCPCTAAVLSALHRRGCNSYRVVIGGGVPASASVGAQAGVRCPHPKQSLLVSLLTSPPPEMLLCTVARGCSRAAAVATLKSESALARPSSVQITVPLT